MLFTLIKNEMIKLLRRGKTWVVSILFVVLIVLIGVSLKSEENYMEEHSSYESQVSYLEADIADYEEELEQAKIDGNQEDIQYYQEELEYSKNQLEELKENGEINIEWREELEKEKENLQNLLSTEETGEESSIKQRINEIDMYLEKDIEPIQDWEFNAFNFAKQFLFAIGMIILVSGIAIFMSDIVSGECTPPTLKFLLVQPISRGKVLLSKFISVVIATVTLICGLELAAFGVVGAATGFEGSKVPTLVGVEYEWNNSEVATGGAPYLQPVDGSGEFITQGEALLRSLGVQVLFIVATCAFVFFISCLFKSSMVTMAVSIAITIAATIIPQLSSTISKGAHLLFISYSHPTELVSGNIGTMYNNSNMTMSMGIIVMLVSTVVFYLLGNFIFKKKDILI